MNDFSVKPLMPRFGALIAKGYYEPDKPMPPGNEERVNMLKAAIADAQPCIDQLDSYGYDVFLYTQQEQIDPLPAGPIDVSIAVVQQPLMGQMVAPILASTEDNSFRIVTGSSREQGMANTSFKTPLWKALSALEDNKTRQKFRNAGFPL